MTNFITYKFQSPMQYPYKDMEEHGLSTGNDKET